MAKKNKGKSASDKQSKGETTSPKLTLKEIKAISSDEDDDVDMDRRTKSQRKGGIEMGGDNDIEDEWNMEARALRQAITEGVFDKLAALTPASRHEEEQDENSDDYEDEDNEEGDDDGDEERVEERDGEVGNEEEEEEEEDDNVQQTEVIITNDKALLAKAEELASHYGNHMPWVETFDVTPETTLPFNDKYNKLDIHDDLKREVAFYNLALEAVQDAKGRCKAAKVPFTRPDDFFAEMIKTDGKCFLTCCA